MKIADDKIKRQLQGMVTIIIRNDETGEVETIGPNLVVNKAYERLAELLGHTSTSQVANIAFGIGGAVPAAASDTSLTGVVATRAVTVSYPYAYTVRFTATWESAAVSAADVNEVGLLFADGALTARYTFAEMRKSVGWVWEIQWELAYAV